MYAARPAKMSSASHFDPTDVGDITYMFPRNKAPPWWLRARMYKRERDAFFAEDRAAHYQREQALNPPQTPAERAAEDALLALLIE